MALPTRCTSLGPMCRSTAAASDSPRLSRKIAALSSLESFCVRLASSLIGIDPVFHDLGHAARVFGQQALDGIELLFVTGAGGRQQYWAGARRGQAHGIVPQDTRQQTGNAKSRVASAVASATRATAAEALEYRPQHPEDQHQYKQNTQRLLGYIPEPGLGPERHLRQCFHLTRRHEGTVDHADAVAAGLIIADRIAHQLGQRSEEHTSELQ